MNHAVNRNNQMKFSKGDAVPDWLVNGEAYFDCDVEVTEEAGEVWIRPQREMTSAEILVHFKRHENPPFKRKTVVWSEPHSTSGKDCQP